MYEMKSEYYTGIELIDEEHKQLFTYADEAYELLHEEFTPDKYDNISHILEELREYTKKHFADEEAYMESIQYKRLFTQKIQHQEFITKLDELNQLSRSICETKTKPEQIMAKLEETLRGQQYSFGIQVLIYALISGSFAVFFGGDARDMIASAMIGILLKFLESFLKKGSLNKLITALICSVARGFLANLSVMIGLGSHADFISIGNIMLLIPGVAFTNSLRDMFSGDTITGLVRFLESVLLAIIIALGFTLSYLLF